MSELQVIHRVSSRFLKRTHKELFQDSYALLRVAIARILRGEKPRFKELFK